MGAVFDQGRRTARGRRSVLFPGSCVPLPSFLSTTMPLKVGQISVCSRSKGGSRHQLGCQSCQCLASLPQPMAAQFKTTHKDSLMWQGILNGSIHTTKGQPCFLGTEQVIEFLKWYISCSQRKVPLCP